MPSYGADQEARAGIDQTRPQKGFCWPCNLQDPITTSSAAPGFLLFNTKISHWENMMVDRRMLVKQKV
jgi:hypothetical protein